TDNRYALRKLRTRGTSARRHSLRETYPAEKRHGAPREPFAVRTILPVPRQRSCPFSITVAGKAGAHPVDYSLEHRKLEMDVGLATAGPPLAPAVTLAGQASSRIAHVRARHGLETPSYPGADRADPPLQPRVHVLQRVRCSFPARAPRRNAAPGGFALGTREQHPP